MRRLQQLHFPMHHKYLLPGNTQPAEFFAFCIIGPVLSAFTGKGSRSCRHSRFHKGMYVERRGYRDIKGSCLACCPVSQQKVSRMGVAMIGCGVIASFHLDAKMGPVACFSQNITKGVVSYHHITATITSGGMMSQRVNALPGHSAH